MTPTRPAPIPGSPPPDDGGARAGDRTPPEPPAPGPPASGPPASDPPRASDAFPTKRFDRAFEDSTIGMAIESLEGRFVAVNAALCSLLGYRRAELLTMTYMDICHPDDLDPGDHLADLAEGTIRSYVHELRYVRADGRVIWVRVHVGAIRDEDGRVVNHTVQIEDVTGRRDAEARLAHQADHDALTGLPNRHALTRHLAEAPLDPSGTEGTAALLFIDLDRFKLVNDSLGHMVGDELLLAVAGRLRHAVAGGDLVARIGGDEFVVLARSARTVEVAEMLAARLQKALSSPFGVAGRLLHITASIGVALPLPGETPDRLLRSADLAMHGAKAAGKARSVVFDPLMLRHAEHRLAVEQGLHVAIETGQLTCWYQPIVSLFTGRTVAAEALVRWEHPEHGLLEPADFLPIADETGLAVPIGRLVLARALDQVVGWRRGGAGAVVNVNLSSAQLDTPGLVGEVTAELAARCLSPSDLCLEVSESALLLPDSRAAQTVTELRLAGISVAIDDFGRGHSPLAYLHSHPVDIIKIDREFVSAVDSNPRDAAIVRAIVALGQALGTICVAEGVETTPELRRLAELGCEQVQGYLLGRPEPAAIFAAQLSDEPAPRPDRLAGWPGRDRR